MSIFDDDNEDIRKSIQFFNQLSEEEKVRVVSDLNPFIFQQKRQYEPLLPLLSKIQNDISKHDAIEIGNKLMEYGLDETYARLFVSNVKKHAPTIEYQLHQINKIPDDVFCKQLPDVMKDFWVDGNTNDVLSERYGIEKEKIECIVNLTGDALNSLSRGITTKEKLEEFYNQHISKAKTDTLINQILIHHEHQRKTIMYSNVQDVFFDTKQIIRQNNEILRLMRELVALKKSERKEQRK